MTAPEAAIDELPPFEDNASAVLCTSPQHPGLLSPLPIRAFFPIVTDRTLDERLTARRTATVRGIHYSYTFLTSPKREHRSNTLLKSFSAPSRLEREPLSMPRSPSPPPQAPSSPPPASDAHPLSSASSSQQQQQQQPGYEKSTIHLQQDNIEPDPHQDNNEPCANDPATAESCPADNTCPRDDSDERQPCLEENMSNCLVVEPTVNLSTPPSRSTSMSRLPIRTSKSMPTQYSLNGKPAPAKAEALPVVDVPKTPVPSRRRVMRADLQVSTTRPASPKPSAAPIRKTMTTHRPASKVPSTTITTTTTTTTTVRTTRVRETDIPIPRKATNAPVSTREGHESKDTKDAKEEEEEEDTAPVRLTPQEKRRREAMRAQQIKLWRVREEREARDARTVARRRLMERRREPSPPPPPPRRAVKFNLKRNKIIEISQQELQ